VLPAIMITRARCAALGSALLLGCAGGPAHDQAPASLVDAPSSPAPQQPQLPRPIWSDGPCEAPAGEKVAFSIRPAGVTGPLGPDAVVPGDAGKRIVRLHMGRGIGASVGWMVATASEVVIGIRLTPFCGGKMPPDAMLEIEIPVSDKPVKFARCPVGKCTGPPRP
jgi:hypothetical protein